MTTAKKQVFGSVLEACGTSAKRVRVSVPVGEEEQRSQLDGKGQSLIDQSMVEGVKSYKLKGGHKPWTPDQIEAANKNLKGVVRQASCSTSTPASAARTW